MYPSFDQALLLERIKDAIEEAWAWEISQNQLGKDETLQIASSGWTSVHKAEAENTAGSWSKEDVLDMVNFVINNGYVKRGDTILKQVKGFGMGLACAGQLANLGCYPVERDFASKAAPKDVEHNYRFIDDIQTLSGCIPSEEQYGMQYKSTRQK